MIGGDGQEGERECGGEPMRGAKGETAIQEGPGWVNEGVLVCNRQEEDERTCVVGREGKGGGKGREG